jgi:hypothetical protein
VRLVASPEARRFIAERGGRLFIWPRSSRCCRSVAWLESATEPGRGLAFRRAAEDDFQVYVPARLARLPDELHVEVRRFPRRRIEAFWDGCAWIV